MDSARFRRVEGLFLAAAALPRDERPDFLRAECGSDVALRGEVEAMLAHDETTGIGGPSEFRGGLQRVLDVVREDRVQPPIPERIGQYEVVRRIALGGMGAVYEARQANPQRRVALKVVRPDALSEEMLRRFLHEAELLGRLQHPGIAQIFEAGTFDLGGGRQPFFAMEFVDGQPLLEFARERGLSIRQRLGLLADVCDAVHHAHQQGVIHRDLKSENVLVVADGQPKILDFGVGRVVDDEAKTAWTAAGQIVGTLAYMSPEQIRGKPGDVDTRADVWALGVMLYELLTDRLPFDLASRSIPEAGRILCEDEPPRLRDLSASLRGDVEAIVGKALEKEKARRYTSASDLAGDLRRHLADLPIQARPTTTWYQMRKFARRHRVAVLGAVATGLALVTGVVSTAVQAVRATRHADATQSMAYRADIAAARSSLALGDAMAAARFLDEAPAALRHWEWRHLRARLDGTEAVHGPEPGAPAVLGDAVIAFGADGTPLALTWRSGAFRVVDVRTAEAVATFDVAATPVAVALAADGTRIAGVDDRGVLRIWDAATGVVTLAAPLPHQEPVVALRFSGDGSVIEASSPHQVALLATATGAVRVSHRIEPPEEYCVAAIDDAGAAVALCVKENRRFVSGRLLRIDGRTAEVTEARESPVSEAVTYSRDGTRIALGTDSGTHVTYLLDSTTLEVLGQAGGHPSFASCAAFSDDGELLATGSLGRIVIHDIETLQVRRSMFVPGFQAKSLRWSPDRSKLLACAADGEVRLIGADDHPFLALRGHGSFVYVADWSPDGTMVASAGWDRTVRLWDALTGELLATWACDVDWCGFVAFSADGARVYAADAAGYAAWDVGTGQAVPLPDEGPVVAHDPDKREGIFGWMPGGSKLATGGGGGLDYGTSPADTLLLRRNQITELPTGVERSPLNTDPGSIRAVAASFDDRTIATGHVDGSVRTWDASNGEPITRLGSHAVTWGREPDSPEEVFCVEFSPDGARLVSGGDDARVVLWDVASGGEVASLEPHDSYVHVVAWSPDGTRILSGSGDMTLRIWDSVPLLERNREIRAAEALRSELRPHVERLLEERGDPGEVAAALRGDASLDPDRRRAALRVLLELGSRPR